MSRGSLDQLDAMRYASEAWRRSRNELLNRPTFCVQGIIDKNQPQISDIVESNLRRQLLEGIEAILCNGEYHVVKVSRQEEKLPPLLNTTMVTLPAEVRVTYRAELTEVQHRHYIVADAWDDYNRCKKSTGRNHRKKDRAKARRLKAERKKLATRLATGTIRQKGEAE